MVDAVDAGTILNSKNSSWERGGREEDGGEERKREGQSSAPWFSRMLYCFYFLALPINSGTWFFLAAL